MPSRLAVALTVALAATLGACAHGRIPGTQIPDTKDNREVLAVVRKAIDALAQRDAPALLSVISTKYFEDNGTPDPKDDYGYEQLKDKILSDTFAATKEMFVEVDVQNVVIQGNTAYADIRYGSRARLELPTGTQWDSHRDFDRIRLDREDGTWKIIGGI